MSELGEIIAPPVGHKNPNEKCPFCPPKARKGYKTYPGSANNSSKLEKIMENPGDLVSEQAGARPQTSAEDDGWVIEQPKPRARRKDDKKLYTFQAHHLISGKQAMEGEPIEDWIKASGKNEKDTGYSINCTGNGFWAPSVPKKHVGKWSEAKAVLTDTQRQKLAEDVMKDFGAQIHIGPHNISDADDPKGHVHRSYDKYLKERLKEVSDRVKVWSERCKCPPLKKPKQVTYHFHNNLDNLSTHMRKQITRGHTRWEVYLSKYALEYHKDHCAHGPIKTI